MPAKPPDSMSPQVEDALRLLTVRERDVVATCTKHFDPLSGECRVDDAAVKARLMRDHNFQTWAAVRKSWNVR